MNEVGPQTHCPGCGLHRDAVVNAVENDDGSWKCASCDRNPPRESTEVTVVLSCPACSQTKQGSQCATCGGLGSVRVPMGALRTYDPREKAAPQVLTEDGAG